CNLENEYNFKFNYFNNKKEKIKLQNNKSDLIDDIEIIDVIKDIKTITNNKESIIKDLKMYRYKISRKEKTKPYIIFTNKQMENIINQNPKTLDDFVNIKGFSEIKLNKYGKDILHILNKYRKKEEYEI
ncbi:MAG TPA: hypothetical protein GX747_05105, partial [Tenericutes bacterium]|nr:hypothetical protein [Mycoplasmatota bacterium]